MAQSAITANTGYSSQRLPRPDGWRRVCAVIQTTSASSSGGQIHPSVSSVRELGVRMIERGTAEAQRGGGHGRPAE